MSGSAIASGFRVPATSIAALGTAEALVANTEEPGAFVYNPALMAFHDRRNLTAGLMVLEPNTRVSPQGGRNDISDDPASPFLIPSLYLMTPVDTGWRLGLNISAPFGLETAWQDETFPAFEGPLDPLEPATTGLQMFNVNPNVAYRVNEQLGLAAGVDYYKVRKAVSDSQGLGLEGDGSGIGWNLAATYRVGKWTAGIAYRSPVKVNLHGEFDATESFGFKVKTKTGLEFPGMLQIGARYQVNDDLGLEFDIDRTGWSSFDELVVRSRGTVLAAGISPGDELARTTNRWRDINSYHFALTYRFNPAWDLRLGYTFNENPQPDSHYSGRYPNADRHLFSVGLKYRQQSWELETGLLYVLWEDRTFNSSTPYIQGDANGTEAFNGKYDNSGVIGGAGVVYYF